MASGCSLAGGFDYVLRGGEGGFANFESDRIRVLVCRVKENPDS
jgi:hypothetical protein